jgi:plasmid stabilization system protein ParE
MARDQLAEIEDYIADAGSPVTAARYVDAIVSYCVGLADFPMRGHRRDDLMPGLRVTNYRGRAVIPFLVDESSQTVPSSVCSTAVRTTRATSANDGISRTLPAASTLIALPGCQEPFIGIKLTDSALASVGKVAPGAMIRHARRWSTCNPRLQNSLVFQGGKEGPYFRRRTM